MNFLIKHVIFACITLCLAGTTAFAQKVMTAEEYYKGKVLIDGVLVDTTNLTPAALDKIHRTLKRIHDAKLLTSNHYYYEYPYGTGELGVRFKNTDNTKSEIYEGRPWGEDGDFKSILVRGNCGIEVSALDIHENNAADYRYHVVQNDSVELVGWTKPSVFKYTADGKLQYAYLGLFNYVQDQYLKVEIYDIKNYLQRDAFLVDWRPVQPAKIDAAIQFFSKRFPIPDNGLVSNSLMDLSTKKMKIGAMVKGKVVFKEVPINTVMTSISLNDIKFRLGDSLQNIRLSITNGDRIYNYKVSLKRVVDGRTDSINLGETNSRFDLYKEFWKSPGKYKISFTPKIHKHGGEPIYLLRNLTTSISFTVLPPMERKVTLSLAAFIIGILAILFIAITIFITYGLAQRVKLRAERQNKEVARQQLQVIRSQLNPHFIFNALAGIQNLMNKNEVEYANKYLARFARITRNILDNSNKELVTIEHETGMLTDYLQMEEMRFGFKFSIDIDEAAIDQQIEIPAMLLQPFAENAVKHGVSALGENGVIAIGFVKHEDTLLLTVKDNGKGFSGNVSGGMGIRLCEERIKLLNNIYKHAAILLNKKWDNNGTLITIELKHWL